MHALMLDAIRAMAAHPPRRPAGRWTLAAMLLTTVLSPGWAAEPSAADSIGERIYREGILPSGAPLQGVRFGKAKVEGQQAACIGCHRRSGMGAVEGETLIEPITGNALFGTGGKVVATMDTRTNKTFNQSHPPYTDETIARLLRDGINSVGEKINPIMPRYNLNAEDQAVLTAYLRGLSSDVSPGATADTIHFATVVAPGVEPQRRQVFLDMLRAMVVQKNASTVPGARRGGGRRHMVSAAEMVLGTERKWELHVWELQGAPDTWGAQLADKYREQPVFAIVSGLADDTWAPIDAFCQAERVPCWFPSVPVATANEGFYSLYFSRGVALEADVLAKHLQAQGKRKPQRVLQVFRDTPAARAGSAALAGALKKAAIGSENVIVTDKASTEAAVKSARKGDVLMFWSAPADAALLEELPVPSVQGYFSGTLLQADPNRVPKAWQAQSQLVYPYELPDKRRVSMAYFNNWMKSRNLPLVDEPMQAEVFFAMDFLTDTVAEMLDNLYRDYLIERGESMLSGREAGKAEQRIRDRQMWGIGNKGESAGASTTIYPHLGLGTGQHFGSKGAYIVGFGKDGALKADSQWIVP